MKHSTPDTMKFRKLQRRLGVPRVVVVGTLELLWITAQRNAPRGDIGKFTDEEIAIEVEWEGDPAALVDALVETGWVDRCDTHRLVIHDWHDHAPRYVHGIAAKQGGIITSPTIVADCSPRLSSVTTPTVVPDCTEQQPNLTKPSLTKPNVIGTTSGAVSVTDQEKPTKKTRPTIDEVKAYCTARRSHVDAVQFFDHYEANGWVQGRGKPIRDWQAAVRTWERNDFGQSRKETIAVQESNRHQAPKLTASYARFQLINVFRVSDARDWPDARCIAEFKTRAGAKKPPAPQINKPTN